MTRTSVTVVMSKDYSEYLAIQVLNEGQTVSIVSPVMPLLSHVMFNQDLGQLSLSEPRSQGS